MKKVLQGLLVITLVSCSHLKSTSTKRSIASEDNCSRSTTADPNCFRLGNEWSKVELKSEIDLKTFPSELHPAARGSVQLMLGGSGILLGEFAGKLVVASAAHICEQNFGGPCGPMYLMGSFKFLGINYRATNIIGFWPEVDLMLFTIEVDSKDKEKLITVGANFDFSSTLDQDLPLAIASYTLIKDSTGNLQLSSDSDCRILSSTSETRLITDPDQIMPDKTKRWAFAMGCDAGPGDSGGAVIDRQSGLLVGLVWTGNSSQKNTARSSDGLAKIQQENDSQLWSRVSYASPAPKIAEYLKKSLRDPSISKDKKEIIEAVLGH